MTDARLKPLFVIKSGTMKPRDIGRAEKLTGICIVECETPEDVRYLEVPSTAEIGEQARAALSMFRVVLSETLPAYSGYSKATLMKRFLNALMEERPPQNPLPVKRVPK